MWTEQETARFRKMAAKGMNYQGMAKALGKSVNAIIGKFHREFKPASTNNAFIRPKKKFNYKQKIDRISKNMITMMQLTNTTCRWPHITKKGTLYCGKQSVNNSPYCKKHKEVAIDDGHRKAQTLRKQRP